jgi:hypothetical protein
MLALALRSPLDARQSAGGCRVSGRATNGATPLPGVSIMIKTDSSSHATSTEAEGTYAINLGPGQYTLSAELTGFTLAKSKDDASNIGGGATVVAQNDQDLRAEYGLSSFDRRHRLSADLSAELPFGPNRHWFHSGGPLAAAFGNWRASTNFTWQSGSPFTPRVTGSASDIARGTNGTLRADYLGGPIQISGPSIDQFSNTGAFAIPLPGTFGSAGRNMIVGPGSRQLNGQVSRDITMRRNRAVTIQATASNLLNAVNYAAIDTVVNSPTFGQVLSARPMRSAQLNFRFRF